MKQGLLLCNPSYNAPSLPSLHFPISTAKRTTVISVSLDSADTRPLTARERRQLRNERRESKATTNWREEVEERLLKKPKKRYASWTEELNLDNLALLGPQWWVVRVSRFRVRSQRNDSPDPWSGTSPTLISRKRQINKPRPVSVDDIEAIFKQSKEEQEKADKAFEEEQQKEETINPEKLIIYPHLDSKDVTISVVDSKPKRRSRKASKPTADGASTAKHDKLLKPGSTVRVVSGTFTEFSGSLKKLDRKNGKATVGFTLFGKETLVDLDVNEIVAETK